MMTLESALSELTTSFADSESDEAKRRRSRTNFSQWQLEELERVFQSCHYPDVFMREAMALKLDLKESRISVSRENVVVASSATTAESFAAQNNTAIGQKAFWPGFINANAAGKFRRKL